MSRARTANFPANLLHVLSPFFWVMSLSPRRGSERTADARSTRHATSGHSQAQIRIRLSHNGISRIEHRRFGRGALRPFYQKSTCIAQLTSGLCVAQIRTRGGHVPLGVEGNETLVLHRVGWFDGHRPEILPANLRQVASLSVPALDCLA